MVAQVGGAMLLQISYQGLSSHCVTDLLLQGDGGWLEALRTLRAGQGGWMGWLAPPSGVMNLNQSVMIELSP